MAIDFRKYTADECAKQLALLEIHLRQFIPNDPVFCMECCGKHLLAIEGLADEGVTFFSEKPEPWQALAAWSRDIRDVSQGADPTPEQAKQWADEARTARKDIQATHMGKLGRCECVTGYEPCCKQVQQ